MPYLTLSMMSRKWFSFSENVNRKRSHGNRKPQSKRISRFRWVSYQRGWLNQTAEGPRPSRKASVLRLDALPPVRHRLCIWVWSEGNFWKHHKLQQKNCSWGNVKTPQAHPISEGLLGTCLLLVWVTLLSPLPNNFALTSKILFRVNLSW